MRPGDTLVIWKLSRLYRSMKHLLETVQAMQDKGIELKSLNESIDTRMPTGCCSISSPRSPSSSATT